MSGVDKAYYDRHLKLTGFGAEAQTKLASAKVLVVGAGGLGCPLLQYLITAGVGTIGIIDGDVVAASNLHRQPLYNRMDIGASKAKTAADKLWLLQPQAHIQVYDYALTAQNALDLIEQYDVIVDGTDNFDARYLINDACVIRQKPFVSGGINDYSGQVAVFNYRGGPTYRCLYPEAPSAADCFSCSVNGVLNVLPGIIALYMANEVIKVITQYGEPLSGKVLVLDLQHNFFQLFDLELDPENLKISSLGPATAVWSVQEVRRYVQDHPETQLIDVREFWEFEEQNTGGINIPLHELPFRKAEIATDRPIIFLCQTGKRSRYAAKLLEAQAPFIYIAKMES